MRKTRELLEYYEKIGTFAASMRIKASHELTYNTIFMKKTVFSWLLCLFVCLLPLSCASSDDDGLEDIPGVNQIDCEVSIDGEGYSVIPYSTRLYRHEESIGIGYKNRPLYGQISFIATPNEGKYAVIFYFDFHVPNFGSGFKFDNDDNTFIVDKRPRTPYHLISSGSAIITSSNSNSCTVEFKNFIISNVSIDQEVKINGTLTFEI